MLPYTVNMEGMAARVQAHLLASVEALLIGAFPLIIGIVVKLVRSDN